MKKHGDPCPGAAAGGNAQMDLGKLGGVFIVVVLGMVGHNHFFSIMSVHYHIGDELPKVLFKALFWALLLV